MKLSSILLILFCFNLSACTQSWTQKCAKLQSDFSSQDSLDLTFTTPPTATTPSWAALNFKGRRLPVFPGEPKSISHKDGVFFARWSDGSSLMIDAFHGTSIPDTLKSLKDQKSRFKITRKNLDCSSPDAKETARLLILKSISLPGSIFTVYKDLNGMDGVTREGKGSREDRKVIETHFIDSDGKTPWIISYSFSASQFDSYRGEILAHGSKLDAAEKNLAAGDLAQKFSEYLGTL
jgi:hypothetical protein